MSIVSITTADMEADPIDPVPQEIYNFRKMVKSDLETTCYHQLMQMREQKVEIEKLNKQIREGLKSDAFDKLKVDHTSALSIIETFKSEELELKKTIDKLMKEVANSSEAKLLKENARLKKELAYSEEVREKYKGQLKPDA